RDHLQLPQRGSAGRDHRGGGLFAARRAPQPAQDGRIRQTFRARSGRNQERGPSAPAATTGRTEISLKAIALGLLATSALVGTAVAQDKIKIGVSIPAATHGFMGGLNWHAAEAEKRLEAANPNIDLIIVTADGPADQAS